MRSCIHKDYIFVDTLLVVGGTCGILFFFFPLFSSLITPRDRWWRLHRWALNTQRPRFPTGDSPGLSKALDVVVVLSCEKRALLDVLKMLGASWLAGFALTKLRILNLTSSCTKVAGVNEISILRSSSGKHVILALSLLIANWNESKGYVWLFLNVQLTEILE